MELPPRLLPATGKKREFDCKCSQKKPNLWFLLHCRNLKPLKGSWFLYPPGKAKSSQYGLFCSVLFPLCLELSILRKQREIQVD